MYRVFLYFLCILAAVSLACSKPINSMADFTNVVENSAITATVQPTTEATVMPTSTAAPTSAREPTIVTTPTENPSPTPETVVIEPTLAVQTRLLEKGHALVDPPGDPWASISWKSIVTERVVVPTPNPSTADVPAFVNAIPRAEKGTLTGVSAPGVFEYPVVQQPAGDSNFVSAEPHVVTQYGHPSVYGVVGLLAHDMQDMAGLGFYLLKPGQEIVLVYGDGSTVTYVVQRIVKFRALSPNSPQSDFEYIEDTQSDGTHSIGKVYGYGEVYNWMYTGDHHVTFQTCLEGTNEAGYQDLSWGRFFVLAYPK